MKSRTHRNKPRSFHFSLYLQTGGKKLETRNKTSNLYKKEKGPNLVQSSDFEEEIDRASGETRFVSRQY